MTPSRWRSQRNIEKSDSQPIGSKALPWNPMDCRLCLPRSQTFVFQLLREAEPGLCDK